MAGSTFGTNFRVTTWGESHGVSLGCVIDGCPAGLPLSGADLAPYMARRRPGQGGYTTARSEGDEVEIMSGVMDGVTTGTPIAMMIKNSDQHSRDYDALRDVYRPGHADFGFDAKYGIRDHRGGGRSSGRETVARVAAGAVAAKILKEIGIEVSAQAIQTGDAAAAAATGDSVGGIIECVVTGMPAGIGEPVFDKLDARLAHAIMSIGAVKGVEIGDGFAAADSYGSENNDEFIMREYADEDASVAETRLFGDMDAGTLGEHPGDMSDPDTGALGEHPRAMTDTDAGTLGEYPRAMARRVKKLSNHSGGILGGMSDGADLVIRAAIKPTPSISQPQQTVTRDGENTTIEIHGRHDTIIVPRAVVVVECMTAITIVDALMENMHARMSSIRDFYS